MKEQQIDLMPQAIRERSQAGVRAGQYAIGYIVVIVLLVVLTTHARFKQTSAQNQHEVARQNAEFVLDTERKVDELRGKIADLDEFIEQYEAVAHPIGASSVVATVAHVLPESVSLDRIDIGTGAHRAVRTPRSRGPEKSESAARRWMTVELGGFAASDQDIAELVSRLQNLDGFRDVSLDFSRTRSVHGQSARAFRLSFRIDLDASYEIARVAKHNSTAGDSP